MKTSFAFNRRSIKHFAIVNVKYIFLGAVLFGIMYDSWLQYRLNAASWDVPHIANTNDVRILFVADPQLIGEKDETGLFGVITRWDSDRYLRRTYAQAVSVIQPHVIVFMGDLLDEGTRPYVQEAWERYAARFYSIFGGPNVTKIYIPGDNDIGGEGAEPITAQLVQRFKKTFHLPYNNPFEVTKHVQLLGWPYSVPSAAYPEKIIPFDFDRATSDELNVHSKLKIVLTHMPLLRYIGEQDASFQLLSKVRPQLIMTAHDHMATHLVCQSCLTSKRDLHLTNTEGSRLRFTMLESQSSSSEIHELQVPTCSYRMGVRRMAYGVLTVSVKQMKEGKEFDVTYSLLWLPSRFPRLLFYLFVASVSFFIFLLYRFACSKTNLRRGW